MSDKVSVIVPCYNCSKFIYETVQSVLQQTFTNYELIVIDGGSKDRSVETRQEYKKYMLIGLVKKAIAFG
jgi:glycosyltransferase involved in cell wall biosynthesis